MGKIADALERHDKDTAFRLDDLKDAPPKRLVVVEPEVKLAHQITYGQGSEKRFSDSLVVLSSPDSADAEIFKVLRGQILFPKGRKVPRSMLVTSTFPAEGKTYVAANLAATFALSIDEHVLLIDADLRRPGLPRVFRYSKVLGLHEHLVGGHKIDELILKSGIDKLSILPAGKLPRNPTEILSSNMMIRFLDEVKELNHNHFIIIDSPPSNVTAETRFLAQHVDGIVYVVKANKTPRKEIEKAIDNIGREKILGVVFNGYEQVRKSYDRYYDHYYKRK